MTPVMLATEMSRASARWPIDIGPVASSSVRTFRWIRLIEPWCQRWNAVMNSLGFQALSSASVSCTSSRCGATAVAGRFRADPAGAAALNPASIFNVTLTIYAVPDNRASPTMATAHRYAPGHGSYDRSRQRDPGPGGARRARHVGRRTVRRRGAAVRG